MAVRSRRSRMAEGDDRMATLRFGGLTLTVPKVIKAERWSELPPALRRQVLQQEPAHFLRRRFDEAAFAYPRLIRQDPAEFSVCVEIAAELKRMAAGLPRDFLQDLEPCFLLEDWEHAVRLGRQRAVCYAGCAALWAEDHEPPEKLLLPVALEIGLEKYLHEFGIDLPVGDLTTCLAVALWTGNWRSHENMGSEFERVRQDALHAPLLYTSGWRDPASDAEPLDPMFPAPEPLRVMTNKELAFLREKIYRIARGEGFPREQARFAARMALDGVKSMEDPVAWRRIRNSTSLQEAIQALLKELP